MKTILISLFVFALTSVASAQEILCKGQLLDAQGTVIKNKPFDFKEADKVVTHIGSYIAVVDLDSSWPDHVLSIGMTIYDQKYNSVARAFGPAPMGAGQMISVSTSLSSPETVVVLCWYEE